MMSGKNTIDVSLETIARDGRYWLVSQKLRESLSKSVCFCSDHYFLFYKPFLFSIGRHDTGCSVDIYIIHPDKSALNICSATYWYYERYNFNKDTFLNGPWDEALSKAKEEASKLAEEIKVEYLAEQVRLAKEQEEKKSKEHAKFKEMFHV